MQYLNFDLEISSASGQDYQVVARSWRDEVRRGTLRLPFDQAALSEVLAILERAPAAPPLSHWRVSPEGQQIQAFGQALFEALFAGEVRGLYDLCLREAEHQPETGLRIRLRIQSSELAALPWEHLYDPREEEYLCLSRKTPLVRTPELAQPLQPLSVALPLRILGMIASPSDQPTLDVEGEQKRLSEALGELQARGLVKLDWLQGRTWEDVQRAMRGEPCDIFHFIGHGALPDSAAKGLIALENAQGTSHLMTATEFARLLTNHKPPRLVVLNVCKGGRGTQRDLFSSIAATLIRRGVPAVLAMQEDITDEAARLLTQKFYEALAESTPVDEAVTEARIAMSIGVTRTVEWATPIFYMRSENGNLFNLTEKSLVYQEQPIILSTSSKMKEQWLKEGHTHYFSKKYKEALNAYEQAIQMDPKWILAYLYRATTLIKLRQYKKALSTYEQATSVDPHAAGVYSKKGDLLWKLNRYEEALEAYEQSLSLSANNQFVWFTKGALLLELGRNEGALLAFEQTTKLDPTFADAYASIGIILVILNRVTEALPVCERAIQLDPSNSRAHYSKGVVLGAMQRYQEALHSYEQAITYDPKYGSAWRYKGDVLQELGRYEEAILSYNRAIQLDSKNSSLYFNKGNALYDLKRYQEAIEAYEHVIRLTPTETPAYYNKGNALVHLNRFDEALVTFEKSIQLDSKDVDSYCRKVDVLRIMKRYAEALHICEQAIACNPQVGKAWRKKGNVLGSLERNKEAIIAFEQAILLDPNDADAYCGKGDVFKALKRNKEALEAYNQAIKLNSKNTLAYMCKGFLFESMRRYQDALQAYEQVISYDPEHGYIWRKKGDVLVELGRAIEARYAYDQARKLGS
jgi:tetratricopeptide (TPR) repeat protein